MAQDSSEAAQDTIGLAPLRHSSRPVQAEPELFAALDLGTNSCRMLIATPEGGHFRVVDAFAKSVRLGIGLERTGHLSRGAIARTLEALEICADKLRRYGVQNARLVATEACRRARNGNHFLALVARETGLRLEVIRPEEEARLAVISCAPLVSPEAEPGAGVRHRRRLDRAGLDRPQRRRAGRPGAGDRQPAGHRRRRRAGQGAHRRLHLGAARGRDAARPLRRRDRRQRALRADVLVLRGADRRLQALPRHPGGRTRAAASR